MTRSSSTVIRIMFFVTCATACAPRVNRPAPPVDKVSENLPIPELPVEAPTQTPIDKVVVESPGAQAPRQMIESEKESLKLSDRIRIQITGLTPGRVQDLFTGADLRVDLFLSVRKSMYDEKPLWEKQMASTKVTSFARSKSAESEEILSIEFDSNEIAKHLKTLKAPKDSVAGSPNDRVIEAKLKLVEVDRLRNDPIQVEAIGRIYVSGAELKENRFSENFALRLSESILGTCAVEARCVDWIPEEVHSYKVEEDVYEWKTDIVWGYYYNIIAGEWIWGYHSALSYVKTGEKVTRVHSYTTGGGTKAGFRYKASPTRGD